MQLGKIGMAQTRILVSKGKANLISHEIFSEPIKILPKYKNLKEIDNKEIPDLLASVLCASNQVWVDFNTLGGVRNATLKKSSDFDAILNRDNSKTSMSYLSKMDFELQGEKISIVKLKLFSERAPNGVTGAYQLQNVAGRWYMSSRSDFSKIALLVMFLKPQVLKNLIEGKSSNDRKYNELLQKVFDSNGISFSKLYNEFSTWDNDKEKTALFTESAW